eukprot:scaffold42585_cov34-Attheya_sp.AAC.2
MDKNKDLDVTTDYFIFYYNPAMLLALMHVISNQHWRELTHRDVTPIKMRCDRRGGVSSPQLSPIAMRRRTI